MEGERLLFRSDMIDDLKKTPIFRQQMKLLRKQLRPEVRRYNPDRPNAVEEWKHDSAVQDGFDLLYDQLVPKVQGEPDE